MAKLITVLLLIVSIVSAQGPPDRRSPKPNFVLVFIDDMGWGDFSCFGNTEAETPHIDRLAAEGIRFEQFYVASPICSPSRVAISTGQYPYRWKITSYLAHRKANEQRGMADWLSIDAPVISKLLKKEGYATGHFGKWHMGGQRDVGEAPLITEYGFDASVTNFEGLGHRILPLKYAPDGKPPGRHGLGSDNLERGPIVWEDRSIITEQFAQHALDFMKAAHAEGQPFYVNVWPDDVHTPMNPPLKDWGDGEDRTRYKAVLENMDQQLSRIFLYLRRTPDLAKNTFVMVCSDNGPEVGFGSPGDFRGAKATLFEAGIRSPLVVWGPGLIAEGAKGSTNKDSLLSSMDLVPSMLSMAGLSPASIAKFDGEEMATTFTGHSAKSREAPLFFRRPPDRENFRHYQGLPDLAVRIGAWKLLCDYDGSGSLLYNLDADPSEKTNLAKEHPEKVREMTQSVLDWNKTMLQDNGEKLGKKPAKK